MQRYLVLISVLLGGCLDALAPDVGPLAPLPSATDAGPTGCPGDSDPLVAISFQADVVRGVFNRGRCTSCHTSGGTGVRQSGLDLSTYSTLRVGGGRSSTQIVVNGDPCASILVQKIEPGPPFGRRMPYDGPPYLALDDIQIVRDWIVEGANDN